VITYQNYRALQYVKDVKPHVIYSSIHTNIFKSAIAIFLGEVLSISLQEEEKNELLYTYLETTFQWLDNQNEYSNFHLLFLLKLSRHLGFYPETNGLNMPFFNLKSGSFENQRTNVYSIADENLKLLKQLLGITFDALPSIKINSKQRQSFLSILLLYFELHLGSFKKPKSLEVFNQVFNS